MFTQKNKRERERERGHMNTNKDKISHILLRSHSAMQWRERERVEIKDMKRVREEKMRERKKIRSFRMW